MRALIRNEPLERHNLPDSAAGVSVHGAGSLEANGIYVRTGFKVANAEVFQKRGTCLVILKRGEGLHWSLINLNGGKGEAAKEEAISSGVYAFSPAKLRWNPNSTTLYQVAPSLHSRDNLLPPHVGWTAVDGLSPAPSMNFCSSESLRPEKLLAAAIPGKLLTRIAESAPTAAKVHTSIHQAWRTDAQQTLPRILRWGTLANSRARKQEAREAREGQRLAQSLSLPDLHASPGASLPILEGEPVMMIYSMVISRPSFHFDWGLSFLEKELEATGRRIVQAVEPNSPFDRWNTWQKVRGRPEMCVRPGDQLLKQSGAWAYFECPFENSEGYEELPSLESGTLEGVGDTLLVLDFGRMERRPCPPEAPRLEPWEAGYGLRIEIDSALAGPYEEEVIAWALVLKEDLSEAAFVSTALGKSESCWRAFDGESGKVYAVLRDAEVGAIMHSGTPITLHLSEGIKTGRTYAACLAVLTEVGWSAFSYPSRPVHVKQRPGLMDGILSLVLPPEDEQYMTMKRKRFARANVFYFLPSDLQAGFSAPIATHSTTSEPCELFSKRRLLKLSLVLPHGRPKGLEVTEEGGSTLYVADEGVSPGPETQVLKLCSHSVAWRLCSGDFITRLNGLSGAEHMLEELRHNPPVLALEVLRPVGGKREGETADIFELNPELDEQCQAMVSEIRTHGLLSSEAELASLSVGKRDDLIQQVLDRVKGFRREVAPKRPSDGQPIPEAEGMDNAILVDAQRRVIVLHRFHMMEQTAKEQGPGSGQLSEACRLLQWALADAAFSPEKLGKSIEDFKTCGGTAVRASAPAQILLKRAVFQMSLWRWRNRLRQERQELKRATQQMVHMEIMDQEHTKRFPGQPMKKEEVERIVQARNMLDHKVRQGQGFRQQLHFEMAEAEAVLRRSLRSAAGQRKLSLQEQNARFNPERTLTVGKQKGWW